MSSLFLGNFPTPHSHTHFSLDGVQTPKDACKRAKELGVGYVTVTDHGTMAGVVEVYTEAKKNKLKPIVGVEGYFRDDNCPLIKAKGLDPKSYAKYFHITLHALDASGYAMLSKLLSKAPVERHGSEAKPLFNWADLEQLASAPVIASTGCLVGMVQRHLLLGQPDLAVAYFDRLKGLFGEKLITEVFPHQCTHNWDSATYVYIKGGKPMRTHYKKWFRLDDGNEVTAQEMVGLAKKGPLNITHVKNYRAWEDLQGVVDRVEMREEFVPNECTDYAPDGDVQKGANQFVLDLANKHGVPILVSDDSHLAWESQKIVQDVRLLGGGERATWRFHKAYHRMDNATAFSYFQTHMGIDRKTFEGWVQNNHQWASRFDAFSLESYTPELPTRFYPADIRQHVMEIIKKTGRMKDDQRYKDRLESDLKLLSENGTTDFLPYFAMCRDLLTPYEEKGVLTGVARGSAGGMLLAYLMGITHVDPIRWELSQERFLTLDRIKSGAFPDIDLDFPHSQLLSDPEDPNKGFFEERFGGYYAQISTATTLKLKSSAKAVARMVDGEVSPEIEAVVKRFQTPPQGVSDKDFVFGYTSEDGTQHQGAVETDPFLQEYIEKWPNHWDITKQCLGVINGFGRHAAARVVTNRPISEFLPTTRIGGYLCTQYTMASAEKLGAIKMDTLSIAVLNDIGDCIKILQKEYGKPIEDTVVNGVLVPKCRLVPFQGKLYDIWDLPEEASVFEDICQGKTETVFQLNTPSAIKWLGYFNKKRPDGKTLIHSVMDVATFTALDRPGPLDAYVEGDGMRHNMLVEFARRAQGLKPVGNIPALDQLLPETYGVLTTQEQLQFAYQNIVGCSGAEAEEFRRNVAKKKMDKINAAFPRFYEAASAKYGQSEAKAMWEMFVAWGQYGFCKAHAVAYAITGYACAFLKHFYPKQWWVSVLRNAPKDEVFTKFWPFVGHMVKMPDINLSGETFDYVNGQIVAPLSLIKGVGASSLEWLLANRPYKSVGDLVSKAAQHTMKNVTTSINKAGKSVTKKGRFPIGEALAKKLIVCGCFDSLFGQEVTVEEKITAFDEAMRTIAGKKPKAIDLPVNAIQAYQYIKKILPCYQQKLLPKLLVLAEEKLDGFRFWDESKYKINVPTHCEWSGSKSYKYIFGTKTRLDAVLEGDMYADKRFDFVIYGFVKGIKAIKSKSSGKSFDIATIEIDGGDVEFPYWNGKTDYDGAMVMAVCSHDGTQKDQYTGKARVSIRELHILAPPYNGDNKDDEE